MKIFYFCYGRAHSSVVAGNIHLQRLPRNRIPSIKEIIALPEFDQAYPRDFGVPYLLGKDNSGQEVYIIGFGKNYQLALQTIFHLCQGHDVKHPDWHFINVLDQIGLVTKIGGFLSRKLGIITIGRYLAALGIQKSYLNLVRLVDEVKEIKSSD